MRSERSRRRAITAVDGSSDSAYANGWYDKTRDDGIRFWAAHRRLEAVSASYLQSYLAGVSDRPHSGIRVRSTSREGWLVRNRVRIASAA